LSNSFENYDKHRPDAQQCTRVKQCSSKQLSCGQWKNFSEFGKKGCAVDGSVRYDPFCLACKSKLRASQYHKKTSRQKRKSRDIKAIFNPLDCEINEVFTNDFAENMIITVLSNHAMDAILRTEIS